MRIISLLACFGMLPVWAVEMPEKAADYYTALGKRPDSAALFERFRDAWLEERSLADLEKELLERAEAREGGAWATLGRAYLAAAKTEQALDAFDHARKVSPAAWLDLEVARLRLAGKDFAAAERDALMVPEGDTKRLEALKLAGLACLRAERIDDALAHWVKAVAAAPGDNGLLEDLTEATRREGRYDLALDYCGKWRDATNDAYGKAMATLRRAELLLGSQRFDEAMTELAAVLEVSADDSWLERETIARAEQAHRQRGNATGWATWIGAQAERYPARVNFRRSWAQALAAAGKTDEALEMLIEVMRRSPGDMTVRWQRVQLLEQSMKLSQAYEECAELAAKENSETARLRLAELAFRLEKKVELKQTLDSVLAAADPAKRVGLAGLYARYGLPEDSERVWREEAGGEQGGQALRQLAKHLKIAGREREALAVWKQLGARQISQDRMEAAQMLAAAGERGVAREILIAGREKFSNEPGYEAAIAELAMADDKAEEARDIYLRLARAAKQSDSLAIAIKGWVRASAGVENPLEELGDDTADRCLAAAWLAGAGKPLPAVSENDALERSVRMALLREQGRWPDIVKMMEAVGGESGPLFLSELAGAKFAAGDMAGALAAAQAWRSRVPDQTGPWLFEAGVLEKLGKPGDATLLLRRAAARFEDNEEVARRVFSVLEDSLDPSESLEWAWKRHDRSADEGVRSGWLREILRVSKERNQLEDLKERFEERVRRDPASPGPLLALAELAKVRGDSREELDLLRRAAVSAPRDMAVISALGALEERSGEPDRALEHFAALARLAPGPESARQFAQAKIRLGDIEGGMRDLQGLAGEKGIDLGALEQSAGDLASRGYVEEAIRLLTAVDPAQRTARLNFVLGMLCVCDGREPDAVDAFMKVMNEPDDPAEIQTARSYGTRRFSQMMRNNYGRQEAIPGSFAGLQVPQSLVEAKLRIKSQLILLAIQKGRETWEKAATVIPELTVATPEQWREAIDFQQLSQSTGNVNWWDFIQAHPTNPLGVELLVEYGQSQQGKPEQLEALLKSNPPIRLQIPLRYGKGEWRADHLEFLESIPVADWADENTLRFGQMMVFQMFSLASSVDGKTPVSAADCARGLAVLEKVGREEGKEESVELLRARLALLQGDPEEFLRHINAWDLVTPDRSELYGASHSHGLNETVAYWRKRVGGKVAEPLIAQIKSPVLRCRLSIDSKPEAKMARIRRELAALPENSPVKTRRELTRMKWSLLQNGREVGAELRKELEAVAASDSDPRLAFEAKLQLLSAIGNGREIAESERLELQGLIAKVANSPERSDQAYAAQFGEYLGRSARNLRAPNTPLVTKWGMAKNFSAGYSNPNRLTLPAIIAMGEKEQAVREAARFLENSTRVSIGRPENLSNEIKSLSEAGLLDAALAQISLPLNAGLNRRATMITLLDACSKTDRVRALLEEVAKSRPWETRWIVELALRSPDAAEMRRLLDSVAERGDFSRIMTAQLASQTRENSAELLARLMRLLDWASESKVNRAWMGDVMLMLLDGGRGGLPRLTVKNDAQLACLRRYVELALDDPRLGELGFRMVFATRYMQPLDGSTEAARKALLSGAYTSDSNHFGIPSPQENLALSALEHLVLVANKNGDENAFPAEFRERLKAVDTETAKWIATMLEAKSITGLPDVSDTTAKSSGWVMFARHEAALLRAVNLPGRDAWLTSVFRDQKVFSLSENVLHVIRQSLLESAKTENLSTRVFTLLEAAAGPRKDWGRNQAARTHLNGVATSAYHLPQAADRILKAATQKDVSLLLSVLDLFREARIPVNDNHSFKARLVLDWKASTTPPGKSALVEYLRSKPQAAFTLGTWQSNGDPNGKMQFSWLLPEIFQSARGSGNEEMAKAIKDNPDAGHLDLIQAWYATSDRTLQRRALLKATPVLAKLPADIRSSVVASLIANMQAKEIKSLPNSTLQLLRENLEAQARQRIGYARELYQSAKSRTANDQSYAIGSLLAPVMTDDDVFVTEVLDFWRPLAEADPSGKEITAFMNGYMSNGRRDVETIMALLRLVDSLTKGSLPTFQRNSNWADPMENTWNLLEQSTFLDPDFWRQSAALSPKLQAQFWTRMPYDSYRNIAGDPKLLETLRQAAKGGEVTHAAFEWCLQTVPSPNGQEGKIDGSIFLRFMRVLKQNGASTADIVSRLCWGYSSLDRMTNPGEVMAETPTLLAGLKSFEEGQSGRLLQGVSMLWERVRRDSRKADQSHSESQTPATVSPLETAALLKFILSRNSGPKQSNDLGYEMTRVVIATRDAELLELWIKYGGKALVGNLELIIALLEKDRIAEALALAPALGRGWSSSRRFDSHLESLVAKLRTNHSPQAISLIIQLSLLYDASGEAAPIEKRSSRQARISTDFMSVRGSLSQAERAGVCLAFGLNINRDQKHVPELDEFVNEKVANEFKKVLLTGGNISAASQLFISAVCSRAFADDLSGITLLTQVLNSVGQSSERMSLHSAIFPVHSAIVAYISRLDGKLPAASVETILAYAKEIAVRKNPVYQNIASQLIYLVSTDATSLSASLGSCGLSVVKPSSAGVSDGQRISPRVQENLLRVSLLHPFASEALLESIGFPVGEGAMSGPLLLSLREPALRAKISPELFLTWNRRLWSVDAKDLEAINLYVAERRGDFSEVQRTELDAWLKRLRPLRPHEEMFRREHEERRSFTR